MFLHSYIIGSDGATTALLLVLRRLLQVLSPFLQERSRCLRRSDGSSGHSTAGRAFVEAEVIGSIQQYEVVLGLGRMVIGAVGVCDDMRWMASSRGKSVLGNCRRNS